MKQALQLWTPTSPLLPHERLIQGWHHPLTTQHKIHTRLHRIWAMRAESWVLKTYPWLVCVWLFLLHTGFQRFLQFSPFWGSVNKTVPISNLFKHNQCGQCALIAQTIPLWGENKICCTRSGKKAKRSKMTPFLTLLWSTRIAARNQPTRELLRGIFLSFISIFQPDPYNGKDASSGEQTAR